MISTSEAWKRAQLETILPETFVEIEYDVTEPGLQLDARESNNGAMAYSHHEEIVDVTGKIRPLYATAEHNIWALDGSVGLLPNNAPYGSTGYVSSAFVSEKAPVVSIRFSGVHDQPIPGLTITWSSTYNEYASRFRIAAYNGNTQILSKEFIGTSATSVCDLSISGYDRIDVTILEWCLPNRRARIERLFLGTLYTYTKSDLIGYTHTQRGDILSAELPKNSIVFSLDNSSGAWNPDNITGHAQYLAEQQKLSVRYGMRIGDNIEWINAGTFWISEWETPSNGLEVKFTARDLIEFMSDVYAGARSGTLYAIAEAALIQAELPVQDNGQPRWLLSDNLKEFEIDFTADNTQYTLAEIVQLCANAGCCVMYQDRSGVIRVEPVAENSSGYIIRRFVSYSHPEFTFTKPLKMVLVNDGLGTAVNSAIGETQLVDNTLITGEVMADRVAEWVRKTLATRKTISGEFRADPSLDVFDKIAVESKYGANNAIYVTEVEYSYNGAFRGKYVGRITDFDSEVWYSGELYSGEV